MSYSSEQTRKRILKCAQKEFAQYGFQKANMRRIAKEAKVTTGAMYNHFANKAVLFDALVQEPAEQLLSQFIELHQQTIEDLDTKPADYLGTAAREGTHWMFEFMYEHKDAFNLIFNSSEGTRWSAYLEQLIEEEEKGHRAYYKALLPEDEEIDDFFLHITSAMGFNYLVEIITHDLPYDRALSVINTLNRYGLAGWSEITGVRI